MNLKLHKNNTLVFERGKDNFKSREYPTEAHGSKPVTYYFVYLDTELYVRRRGRKRTQIFLKLLFIVFVRLVVASSGSEAVFHFNGA